MNEYKIHYCELDTITDNSIIPANFCELDFDIIVLGDDYMHKSTRNEPGIEIQWWSNLLDGDFILVIDPNQIYLRSIHSNPNPNNLYWCHALDCSILEDIRPILLDTSKFVSTKGLWNRYFINYGYKKLVLEDMKQGNFNGENMEEILDDHYNKAHINLSTILNEINKSLASEIKIPIPEYVDFRNCRYPRLLISIEDYSSQIRFPEKYETEKDIEFE